MTLIAKDGIVFNNFWNKDIVVFKFYIYKICLQQASIPDFPAFSSRINKHSQIFISSMKNDIIICYMILGIMKMKNNPGSTSYTKHIPIKLLYYAWWNASTRNIRIRSFSCRCLGALPSPKKCHQIYHFMEINDRMAEIVIFHRSVFILYTHFSVCFSLLSTSVSPCKLNEIIRHLYHIPSSLIFPTSLSFLNLFVRSFKR